MTAFTTRPQLARRYGISPDKVLAWIARGELRAVNLAGRAGGRPRWRIAEADVAAFEAARAATPRLPVRRRRRRAAEVITFF